VLISQFSVRTAIFLKSEGLQLYNKTESEKELKPRRDDIITQSNQTDIFHCTQPRTFSVEPYILHEKFSFHDVPLDS
jgi:hypothetical protein